MGPNKMSTHTHNFCFEEMDPICLKPKLSPAERRLCTLGKVKLQELRLYENDDTTLYYI